MKVKIRFLNRFWVGCGLFCISVCIFTVTHDIIDWKSIVCGVGGVSILMNEVKITILRKQK